MMREVGSTIFALITAVVLLSGQAADELAADELAADTRRGSVVRSDIDGRVGRISDDSGITPAHK